MKFFLKTSIFMLCLVFFGSCKHDSPFSSGLLGGQDCSYSIEYDAEVTMTEKPINAADFNRLSPQDKVGLMPYSTRNEVNFCLKKDGASEWVIEKKQPQAVFEAKSYTLPDPSPKTKTIRIRDDKATFIDESGKIIRETPFEINKLTISLKEMVKLADATNSTGDFDKMLVAAQKDGATIKDLGEGLFNLTKKIPTSEDKVTVTVDKKIGRIVGNGVTDPSGKLKFMTIYTYEKESTPIIKNVIQRSFKTTSSGVAMVSQKITQFHKLVISGSLKEAKTSTNGLD